jgi:ATP-dependent DNA helicase RecQ
MLLEYFDEKNSKKCGKCDVCTGRHEGPSLKERTEITEAIKKLLLEKPCTNRQLIDKFSFNKTNKVISVLSFLIDNKQVIKFDNHNLHWNDL